MSYRSTVTDFVSSIHNLKAVGFEQPAASFLVCSLIFIDYEDILKAMGSANRFFSLHWLF
ncbi:hypothetical protein [Streptococcus pneumoniae]|uniref:hypothetical protein n=1 Tax=Streptococcus pneumoniae TaxID=1313 RepID=UPI000A6C5657|nr:hypothetical protein [Streptococcus pneumoniae]